jgi:hypothetical protein
MPLMSRFAAASGRSWGEFSDGGGGPFGQSQYTTPGTYTWVAPAGVCSVSAVAIGGGGSSTGYGSGTGAGGGLAWKNNIPVTPGQSYTVFVGSGGIQQNFSFCYESIHGGFNVFFSTKSLNCVGARSCFCGNSCTGVNAFGGGGGFAPFGGSPGNCSINFGSGNSACWADNDTFSFGVCCCGSNCTLGQGWGGSNITKFNFGGYNFKFGQIDNAGGAGAGGYTGHGGGATYSFFSNFFCSTCEEYNARGGGALGAWVYSQQYSFIVSGGGVGICGMKNDTYFGSPEQCLCRQINSFSSSGVAGFGGSCGQNGAIYSGFSAIQGSCYGGGVPFSIAYFFGAACGGSGAVRIIWGNPTCCRAFPCCNTGCAPGGGS